MKAKKLESLKARIDARKKASADDQAIENQNAFTKSDQYNDITTGKATDQKAKSDKEMPEIEKKTDGEKLA